MSPGPAIIKISDGFVIHCLTETNYHQWAKGITTHLMMTDSWIPHIIDEPPKNPSKTFILRDNVICSLISSTIDQNQMHLVSDAHGYPMFAKACWESIKAAYTSAFITDGMDLYRDLNKVFYDPSLGVAKLLDQMDLLRRKLAVAAVTFADPIWVSMVASKLLDGSDAWLSCRGTIKNLQLNELHPSQFRNFLLKEERVLIDARVLGTPQSCDTALFNNNGISNHNRGFNGISSQHRINNNSSNSNRNRNNGYNNQNRNNGQSNHNQRSNQQTNDCCNKPQFSYSSNISQLHSTYDSVFLTQHISTIKTKDTERDMAFMAIANSDDLISDSGATAHMTCRKEWLFDYTPISHYSVSTATKEPHIVEGKGTLRLLSYHDGKAVPISITNVLYVPNYAVNLISECCLEEKGCTIESSKNGRIIYDKYGNVAFIANRHNKLNKLNCKIVIPIKDTIIKDKQDQSLAVSSTIKSSKPNRTIYNKYGNVAFTANRHNNFNKLNRKIVIPIKDTIIKDRQDQSLAVSSTFKSPATISVWNQRLGHLSDSGIQTLTKRAQGQDIIPNKQGDSIKYEPCISGKAHRAPFPTPITTTTTTTKVNQFLHMDIAEPMNLASANHVKQVKLETIIPVKAIFSDNGGKFKSRDSDAFLTSKETSRQLATPYTPQQTGTAERKNQNIMNSARSMVIKSGLSPSFLVEAVSTANYIQNCFPHSYINGVTPFDKWTSLAPWVVHLRAFEYLAHALRTPALITKLRLRTMQCIMLGYATGAKAYRLLNSSTNTIITCCDAFFKETKTKLLLYFSMRDLGPIHTCLNVKAIRYRLNMTMVLSQRHYLQDILEQFQMSNYHPAATLAEVSNTLVAAQEQEGHTASPYCETVGSPIYAMIATRPDISAAISQVSKYLYYPTDTHWSAVNRIIRSIKYFLNHPFTFSNNVIYLTGYYNVDWGSNLYSRRNTSGYVFFLGNSCISWRSSKQTVVALSTAKAKYVSATTATQELLFLKTFLTEIRYPINKTTTLYSDSQSAISNTKNIQLRHASNKHMDIKLHFPKDQVKLGNVNLKYINTLDQVADILIKGYLSPPSASSQIYSVCSLFASRRGVEILAVPP
ncbi:hypothetical protein BASA50_004847 [Batrachochytrium salamandrivorans]|uniref:Integrase catalytic domain-containing protein n=1 Tax=Batrachochytrium salamandrivorans TaxID=1357716 RepID=A0ABQ8FED4_9FUNG|nr:hypothetical protein BASA50_004846 [Batrachochytrium salamandrivorans]KAH6596853.1 hypothetical protein BASA50_004847 [Batrachochytrium salamandrivorans]